MPVKVVKRKTKWRIVEAKTNRIVSTGKKGGHSTKKAAQRQARAINRSLRLRDANREK